MAADADARARQALEAAVKEAKAQASGHPVSDQVQAAADDVQTSWGEMTSDEKEVIFWLLISRSPMARAATNTNPSSAAYETRLRQFSESFGMHQMPIRDFLEEARRCCGQ